MAVYLSNKVSNAVEGLKFPIHTRESPAQESRVKVISGTCFDAEKELSSAEATRKFHYTIMLMNYSFVQKSRS